MKKNWDFFRINNSNTLKKCFFAALYLGVVIFSMQINVTAETSGTVYAKLNKNCSVYVGYPNAYSTGSTVKNPYWHAGGGTFFYKTTGCYYNEGTGAFRPYLGKPKPEWLCPDGYAYAGNAKCTRVSVMTPQQKCVLKGGKWRLSDPRVPDSGMCVMPESGQQTCTKQGRVWDTGDPRIPDDSYCSATCASKSMTYNSSTKRCIKQKPKRTVDCKKYGRPQDSPSTCGNSCTDKNKIMYIASGSAYNYCVTPAKCKSIGRVVVGKTCVVRSTAPGNPDDNGGSNPAPGYGGNNPTPGNGNNPPKNPNNKARQNCENKLHRVWVSTKNGKGKCSNKCQPGFQHPKGKPHVCVAKKDNKDKKKPTVKLVTPATNSTASKNIKLAATAKDNQAVSKVVFYANVDKKDGKPVVADTFKQVATDGTKPYTGRLNTAKLPEGAKLKVYAVAIDSNGNKAKSEVANVTVQHKTTAPTPTEPEGDCTKGFAKGFSVAVPDALKSRNILNDKGIAAQSTCDAAGQSATYTIKLDSTTSITASDIAVYRQTSDGKYPLSEDVTVEDVDDEGADTTHVEISYTTTDGDGYDLNTQPAAILNNLFLSKVVDENPETPTNPNNPNENKTPGTTTTNAQTGAICTALSDGSQTCTDASGNTYTLGAKGKGAGVLPNTGTSALVGLFALAAAGVGAVVYKVAKKRGIGRNNGFFPPQ